MSNPAFLQQRRIADGHPPPADGPDHALAGDGGEIRDFLQGDVAVRGRTRDGGGERMFARFLQTGAERKDGGFIEARGRHEPP